MVRRLWNGSLFHPLCHFCLISSTMRFVQQKGSGNWSSFFVRHNIFTQRLFLEHFIQQRRSPYFKSKEGQVLVKQKKATLSVKPQKNKASKPQEACPSLLPVWCEWFLSPRFGHVTGKAGEPGWTVFLGHKIEYRIGQGAPSLKESSSAHRSFRTCPGPWGGELLFCQGSLGYL